MFYDFNHPTRTSGMLELVVVAQRRKNHPCLSTDNVHEKMKRTSGSMQRQQQRRTTVGKSFGLVVSLMVASLACIIISPRDVVAKPFWTISTHGSSSGGNGKERHHYTKKHSQQGYSKHNTQNHHYHHPNDPPPPPPPRRSARYAAAAVPSPSDSSLAFSSVSESTFESELGADSVHHASLFTDSSCLTEQQQQQQRHGQEDSSWPCNNEINTSNKNKRYSTSNLTPSPPYHPIHQQRPGHRQHLHPHAHNGHKVEHDWEGLISRLSGGGNNKVDPTTGGNGDGGVVAEALPPPEDFPEGDDWNPHLPPSSLYPNETIFTTTATSTSTSNATKLTQSESSRRRLLSLPPMPQLQLLQLVQLPPHIDSWQAGVVYVSSRIGPTLLTLIFLYSQRGTNRSGRLSYPTLYGLALLGASCGFCLFLYFITVGYALGVTLPVVSSLLWYSKKRGGSMTLLQQLFNPTYLHSLLTVLWGIRIFVFLVWREYVSWPALHQKVVEVQSRMDIPYLSKLLCWMVYSLFYVALVTPCWSRLEQNCLQSSSSSSSCWGLVGYTGLFCQVVGLVLETVADWQKSTFKQQHDRHAWCHVGVWKWSTHPNYLGEGLFWWGTYLAHGFGYRLWHTLLATIGVLFITFVLKGSTRSLSLKHIEKYGDQPAFCQFQKTHTIWGSKKNWNKQNSNSSSNSNDEEEVPTPESVPVSPLSLSGSGEDGGTSSYDGMNGQKKSDSWI